MTCPKVFDFNNHQMCFALVPDDMALGLEVDELWDRTEANLKKAVALALRKTYEEESEHTLYVLVNSRNWLSDPLRLITEAVESQGGAVESYNVAARKFSVHTRDKIQLNIFILGEVKRPKEDGEESDEEVEEEEDMAVTKIPNTAVKRNVMNGRPRASVTLDDSESDSDYEDFYGVGLTQVVGHFSTGPFELPDV
jgi:hypothetical protein